MPYVYILECADGSYYVGSTKDIERRLSQHAAGEGAVYTRTRRPVRLVHLEEFSRIDDAFLREKQVQNWSRAKRRALIEGRQGDLRGLSGSAYRRGGLDTPPAAATRPPGLDTPPPAATRPPGLDTPPPAATRPPVH